MLDMRAIAALTIVVSVLTGAVLAYVMARIQQRRRARRREVLRVRAQEELKRMTVDEARADTLRFITLARDAGVSAFDTLRSLKEQEKRSKQRQAEQQALESIRREMRGEQP